MFIPGWKDLLRTLWVLAHLALWRLVGIPIFDFFKEMTVRLRDLGPVMVGIVLTGLIIPFLSTALIHHALFGKRNPSLPAWMPTRVSWWEATWIYGSCCLGSVISFFAIALLLFIWSAITHFAIVDISPSVVGFFNTDFGIVIYVIGWFYIVALVMKLQRWSNRAKEKPPAATEGK
ncbi:hypothetical protein IQ218_13845 [Synechocystis salina LEGE 06099]|uniref:hypothetical protein n=1 Tax=Synechocystis salina TaxID=945780 RepID=UPI001880489F|nr:hypothetical protein [Synechocystis salina]MBE9204322.1 hypothetical protein [Synechocystis salina LEGE 06099]